MKQGQHTRHEKQDPLRNQMYELIQESFPGRLDDYMVRTAIGTACYNYARGVIDRDQLIAEVEYALCYDRKHWPKEFWAEFGEIESE